MTFHNQAAKILVPSYSYRNMTCKKLKSFTNLLQDYLYSKLQAQCQRLHLDRTMFCKTRPCNVRIICAKSKIVQVQGKTKSRWEYAILAKTPYNQNSLICNTINKDSSNDIIFKIPALRSELGLTMEQHILALQRISLLSLNFFHLTFTSYKVDNHFPLAKNW